MFRKVGEATQLLFSHLPLFGFLILTVWLPGNLLVNYLTFFVFDPEEALRAGRVSMWIEGLFGPVCAGAIVYALWQIKHGERVGYGEAIAEGFRNWGRLFAARFVAGLLVLVGLLLFIVPGVVLALRYAFLDQVVIVEEAGATDARRRSTELTASIKLKILILAVLLYLVFIAVAAVLYVPIAVVEELGMVSMPAAMAIEVVADCILDIVFAVLPITLFLCYWDQRVIEHEALSPPPDGSSEVDRSVKPPEWHEQDDDNPFRSPRA